MMRFFDKQKAKAYAEINIWGEKICPNEITQILSVLPTASNEVGELGQYGNRPFLIASWEYATQEHETEDVSVQIGELISVFENKVVELNDIRNNYKDCTIFVSVVLYNHQKFLPAFTISAEQIAFLASIGAGIDFDIYQS